MRVYVYICTYVRIFVCVCVCVYAPVSMCTGVIHFYDSSFYNTMLRPQNQRLVVDTTVSAMFVWDARSCRKLPNVVRTFIFARQFFFVMVNR